MLGDISPQTVRITQQAVVYPNRDHVTSLRVERFDGRTYKPVDMTAVTRVILSFPEADPVIVYDSSVQAVFTHVGATLTVDLSDYAMPASVLGCQIILYDAEHPAGQVLVDDIDAVVQFDFRNVSPVGGIPAPAVDYLTDAPIDGVTYARKDGLWVPVDALVSGVSSVNGQSGVVVLDAADVGADAAGTGASAAAEAVAAHTAASDPHPQYLTPAEGNAAYDASGAATSAVAAHVAESDPHPQYTTQSEGDARYERGLTAGTNITIDRTNPAAPVISASGGGGAVDSVNGQTGVVVLDAADVGADAAGTAAAAVAAHVAATNPHPEYLTPAEGDAAYAPIAHVGAGGAAHANAVAAGAAGFMTGADKTKLDGVATGATTNATNAELRDRATHTGQQAASTISDFAATVRATVLTGLSLASGAAIAATDSALVAWGKLQKQINDLVTALAGKQETLVSTTNIKTVNGVSLLGAGNLAVASLPVVQTFTGAKTLGLADINTYNVSQDATAQPVTLPAQATVAWTDHAELHIEQGAAGAVTITGAAGVTINGVVAPSIVLFAKGAVATLKRKGLNNWTLVGAIGTAADQRAALGLGAGDSPSFAGVSVTSGPLALVGNGRRITGEYSAGLGSLANRTIFQSATVNGQTLLTTMPNGTSQNAGFQAFANAADLENSARATFAVVGGVSVFVGSERTGSAPYLPLALSTGGLDRLTIATTGEITTLGIYASTTASAANVFVDATGLLQRSTSSEQYKSDIEPMSIGYAELAYELQPIWYRSKCENDSPEWSWWGFSAEQAATVDPRLVHWRTTEPVEVDGPIDEETGMPRKVVEHRLLAAPVAEGFAYERLTVHHNALLTAQRNRIEAVESTIANLLIRLNALEAPV